jgi:hypothetical protein
MRHIRDEVVHRQRDALSLHADEIDPSLDPAIAATVIGTVMGAMAHKAVLERSTSLAGKTAANEGMPSS